MRRLLLMYTRIYNNVIAISWNTFACIVVADRQRISDSRRSVRKSTERLSACVRVCTTTVRARLSSLSGRVVVLTDETSTVCGVGALKRAAVLLLLLFLLLLLLLSLLLFLPFSGFFPTSPTPPVHASHGFYAARADILTPRPPP